MWSVVGGTSPGFITRPCRDREEAEQWAYHLVEAGITPVRINGVPFLPDTSGSGRPAAEVASALG